MRRGGINRMHIFRVERIFRVEWLISLYFCSRVNSRNLGECNRMRTTISRRKSRTRPSCICERVTCLGRTRVMRLPDSAKCRRFVDVATDMYDTHVSDAQVHECWSHDIVRNELSLLPLSWRPSGLPKSREEWFMREHEIEKAQLQEEASWRMDRKVLWTTHAEKETGKEMIKSPSRRRRCLSNVFLHVLQHTCNYDLNVFRGLCGGSSLAIVYAARKCLLNKNSYANVQFTCLAANHYRYKWFLRRDYCITK